MEVLASYWQEVATGDAYMAMALHLESQDRLIDRSSESALLNAIKSVESLYASQNPNVNIEKVPVIKKVKDAVACAGDVGAEIRDAWPLLDEVGKLRTEVAHGKAQPDADFGLRCIGGATALQWIQRVRLLSHLGIDENQAQSIVSNNFRYPQYLKTLQRWNAELGA